ncbi:MAG: UDP-glucose 4-epimerase GalE [Limnochordales bacterium]|nr:UDP-glucose 4-epimerase GalE [Limnochordales bacterium]
MWVMVTGGAGYIGSHAVLALREAGFDVVVYDNLSRGFADALASEDFRGVPLVRGDVGDRQLVGETVRRFGVQAVMHFAALAQVAESVAEPVGYFRNNLVQGLDFVETLLDAGINTFIFSSTAAVYGEPQTIPIPEDHPTCPTNPYGMSKLSFEYVLASLARARGLRYATLRYFNVAGADPQGRAGERHDPETHLIPLVLRAASSGKAVDIFGTDYPTPDGTCIRDYIHVTDLVAAHILALRALLTGAVASHLPSGAGYGLKYNLGSQKGYSVREIITAAEKVVGHSIKVREAGRRPGDPAVLVASSERIRQELGWQPRFGLDEILATAWAWEQKRQTVNKGQSEEHGR